MWCDLESPTAYREIVRKARKPHTCGDCKGQILPGERYTYLSGIWDGEPSSYHRCQDCTHLRCEIVKETDADNCMALNGLVSWLHEYGDGVWDADSPWFRWVGMLNAVSLIRGGRKIDTNPIHERCVKETSCQPATTALLVDANSNPGDTPVSPSPSVSG